MTDISTLSQSEMAENRLGAIPYVFTAFLSAALVFLVQPMFAKMALPVLGGSSSVWNVTLVCFQAALLGGYIYAHLLARLSNLLAQCIIHFTLLAAAAFVLPLGLTEALGQPDPNAPTLWLIAAFSLSIAPPFMAISATAPLIQAWYARSGREDASNPYYLYAASNVGSLFGLLAYPLLFEPLLPLALQSLNWSLGYGVLAFSLIACGLLAWRSGAGAAMATAPMLEKTAPPSMRLRLEWLALAFIPSSLLIGTTTHIATDIGSAPFLWAPPLILYITSFIIVFSDAGPSASSRVSKILPICVAAILFLITGMVHVHLAILFVLDLLLLFVAAIVCHGLMAESKPEADRLTEFYLLMSLGGVLGGAFNALLAPVIFNTFLEFPLMLILVLLVRGAPLKAENKFLRNITVAACIIAGLYIALSFAHALPLKSMHVFAFTLVAGVILLAREQRYLPAIAATALVAMSVTNQFNAEEKIISERSFFGIVKTVETEDLRYMQHGTTLHGSQLLNEKGRPTPLSYYHPATPIGQVFTTWNDTRNIGVVGLGVGSVACHLTPQQKAVFFEIDPLVAHVAKDKSRFTFLSTCAPDAPIIVGDGRLTLQDQPEGAFDLMLIDAFSSDAIPAHLLTLEALEIYMSRLAPNGVMAIHISNRYIDLKPVIGRATQALSLPAYVQFYRPSKQEKDERATASEVILIAHNEAALARIIDDPRWPALATDGKRPWTDDYTNIVGALIETRNIRKAVQPED